MHQYPGKDHKSVQEQTYFLNLNISSPCLEQSAIASYNFNAHLNDLNITQPASTVQTRSIPCVIQQGPLHVPLAQLASFEHSDQNSGLQEEGLLSSSAALAFMSRMRPDFQKRYFQMEYTSNDFDSRLNSSVDDFLAREDCCASSISDFLAREHAPDNLDPFLSDSLGLLGAVQPLEPAMPISIHPSSLLRLNETSTDQWPSCLTDLDHLAATRAPSTEQLLHPPDASSAIALNNPAQRPTPRGPPLPASFLRRSSAAPAGDGVIASMPSGKPRDAAPIRGFISDDERRDRRRAQNREAQQRLRRRRRDPAAASAESAAAARGRTGSGGGRVEPDPQRASSGGGPPPPAAPEADPIFS